MNIRIDQRQNAVRISPAMVRRLVRLLLSRTAPRAEWPFALLWIIFTDDALMTEVNQETFGKAAVTDVITRSFAAIPGDPEGATAEIFVNVSEALRRGRTRPAACAELALYLAHGCDHLGGADDATPAGRRTMRRRELRWLSEPEVRTSVRGLLRPPTPRPALSGSQTP